MQVRSARHDVALDLVGGSPAFSGTDRAVGPLGSDHWRPDWTNPDSVAAAKPEGWSILPLRATRELDAVRGAPYSGLSMLSGAIDARTFG